MNLYDFCRAVARHADRRTGITVCAPLVDDHRMLLNRWSGEDEFRAAFHRMMQTFAPHDEVGLINVPFTSRSMALFLVVRVVGCGYGLPQDIWQKSPVLQNHLAAAMRHLLLGLVPGAEPQTTMRPSTRAAKPVPPPPRHPNEEFLTREENACLQWGNLTSDAAYVMALAERLRPLRVEDRQTVLEAIRADIAVLPEITLEEFAFRLKTYSGVPAAKA